MKKVNNIQKLDVFYNANGNRQKAGNLVLNKNKIYFKYVETFLSNGFNLSPFKLKFTDEIQLAPNEPFEGMFGVFDDALPDGWGRLLVDRFLSSHQMSSTNLTPLDRLSYVGENGAGAIEFVPSFENPIDGKLNTTFLEKYAEAALDILGGENHEILDDFYDLGGTSGGARPKVEVTYNPATEQLKFTKGKVEPGFESWIIKFPSTNDLSDIAHVEFAYAQMAKSAGITISDCRLFPSSLNDKHFFGTKRFDRMGNQKIHKHSLAGLLHDNFRQSTLDYGHIMDAAFQLTKSRKNYEEILRLAAFNVFTSNQDDHSKNFSFLMNHHGEWEFSPAYDLTFSPSIYNFHSLSVAGNQQNVGGKELLELAKYFGLKKGKDIIAEVLDVVQSWKRFAKDAGVSRITTNKIQRKLQSISFK